MAYNLINFPLGWRRWFNWGLWNPDKGRQLERPPFGGPTSAGTDVSDTRAMQVSAVFSCIRLIAECCGSLPLTVYRRKSDGTREIARDHWLAGLLAEPNPQMTAQEFREALVVNIASWGNGYSEVVRNSPGRPVELWPLKSDGMEVQRDGYEGVRYTYRPRGLPERKDLDQRDVLHIKGFGADGFIGLSPLGMAREALGIAVAAENYAGGFYANGGKPSGVLMLDKVLTDEQYKKVENKYAGLAQGGEQGGNKLWVLESFAKYQQITIPPEDAQMLQTRQFQLAEIARFYRVPLFLLMEMEKSTSWGSGLEQQNLAFLGYTLRPYLTRIEQAINRWLLSSAERKEYYVEHNVEGLLRADSKARADFYSIMTQNGVMTRNEARDKENLPPMAGGELLTAQVNLVPLQKLGVDPVPSAEDEAIKALLLEASRDRGAE